MVPRRLLPAERHARWSPRSATTSPRRDDDGVSRSTSTRAARFATAAAGGRAVALRDGDRGIRGTGRSRSTVAAGDREPLDAGPSRPGVVPGAADGAGRRRRGADAAPGRRLPPWLERAWRPAVTSSSWTCRWTARLTEPHPVIASTRGCVAIERGPLVYCLEQADHPDVRRRRPPDRRRAPRSRPLGTERLDGVVIVRRPRLPGGRLGLAGSTSTGRSARRRAAGPPGVDADRDPLLRVGQPRAGRDARVGAAGYNLTAVGFPAMGVLPRAKNRRNA